MTKRNSFVLYYATADDLIDLTDEECGKLFRALFDYAINGREPSLSPMCMMAFRHIRRYIDANEEKYRQKCEKNSAAGKISAQVRREAAAKRAAEQAVPGNAASKSEQTLGDADGCERRQTPSNLYEYDHESVSDSVSDHGSASDHGSVSDHDADGTCGAEPSRADQRAEQNFSAGDDSHETLQDTAMDAARYDSNEALQGTAQDALHHTSYDATCHRIPSLQQVRDYCRQNGLSTDPERFFRINEQNGWCVGGKAIRDWRALLRGWSKYDAAHDCSRPRAARQPKEEEEGEWMRRNRELYEQIMKNPPGLDKYMEIWS